jgi:alcohol dehydrogenase
MKCKAAVLHHMGAPSPYGESRPLQIETVKIDPPGQGEVLVRVAAAGLCHSDLSVVNGDRPRPMPMVLGHEAAGVVEQIGDDVRDLAVGDHVVMVFMPSCGHCVPCAEGRPALCEPGALANSNGTLLTGAQRLYLNGKTLHHHLGCSAFAEYAVVSRRSLVKIAKDLPLKEAALFGCAVLTGVGAVVNTAGVKPGQTVAVLGLGGVGLAAVLGAVASGASRIVAIDLREDKLLLARGLGATDFVNASEANIVEHVRDLTGGGVDFAFEFAGSERALETAWMITKRGGVTATAGLPPPSAKLSINIVKLVAEERLLRGSYIGSCVPVRDIPRYIALYRSGRLAINKLMSDRLALEEINFGLDKLQQGAAVRQIIQF